MANLLSSKSITFVDVETTHLDPARSTILSISIITDWSGGDQDVWTTKIKPRDIEIQFADPEALRVCGYSSKEWEDAPSFKEVAPEIVKRLAWGPIVGHNVQFDISHIRSVLNRNGYEETQRINRDDTEKTYKIGYPQIDTCALAYLFLPTERQNLNALREYFEISTDRAHSADTDVEDCRVVFYKIIESRFESEFSKE